MAESDVPPAQTPPSVSSAERNRDEGNAGVERGARRARMGTVVPQSPPGALGEDEDRFAVAGKGSRLRDPAAYTVAAVGREGAEAPDEGP